MTAQTNHKKIVLSLVVSALALLAFTSPAFAQTLEMSAIPPKLELKGNPGQTLKATLKVGNASDVAETFMTKVEDFIVADNQGTPIPVAFSAGNRWSLAKWITAPEIIPVDSKSVNVYEITIKIPLTALPGGHYAMITYTPSGVVPVGSLKKTGSVITNRVGTLVYVVVNGPVVEKATLTKFSVPKFLEQGPVDFNGTIHSLSDIHIDPIGTLTITNPLNMKVAEINVDAGNIFPESSRDFTATWNQKWGFGRYKADLNLAYGTAGVITSTVFFWLFPIRLIIYILLALISILVIIIILNKRGHKHQEELEKEVKELKEELQNIETK